MIYWQSDVNDPMYGPAVCCKSKLSIQIQVSHQCIRPRFGAFSLRAIMDSSASSFFLPDRPQAGRLGHQGSTMPGRPFSPSFKFNSRTSAGSCLISFLCLTWLREAIPSEPPSLAHPTRQAPMAERGGGHSLGDPKPALVTLHDVQPLHESCARRSTPPR